MRLIEPPTKGCDPIFSQFPGTIRCGHVEFMNRGRAAFELGLPKGCRMIQNDDQLTMPVDWEYYFQK
jgi:hypothetical protein